jgi:hypothetical protein
LSSVLCVVCRGRPPADECGAITTGAGRGDAVYHPKVGLNPTTTTEREKLPTEQTGLPAAERANRH